MEYCTEISFVILFSLIFFMYQRTGLVKLRRVLRAIRKHILQPPEDLLAGNPIDKFLDDPNLCEDKLSEEAGSDGFLESITKRMFPDVGGLAQYNATLLRRYTLYSTVGSFLIYFTRNLFLI